MTQDEAPFVDAGSISQRLGWPEHRPLPPEVLAATLSFGAITQGLAITRPGDGEASWSVAALHPDGLVLVEARAPGVSEWTWRTPPDPQRPVTAEWYPYSAVRGMTASHPHIASSPQEIFEQRLSFVVGEWSVLVAGREPFPLGTARDHPQENILRFRDALLRSMR